MEHSSLEKRKRKQNFISLFSARTRPMDIKNYEVQLNLNYQCIKFSTGKIAKHLLGSHLIFKWLSGFSPAFLLLFTQASSPQIEM